MPNVIQVTCQITVTRSLPFIQVETLERLLYPIYLTIAFTRRRQWHPTLAWKIPWTEESGGLQSMGSHRVRHDWATSRSLFTFMHWRRKWQPTPVFLPGESQGRGFSGGLLSMGSHRVGRDWRDLAAAAAAAAFTHIGRTVNNISKISSLSPHLFRSSVFPR